VNLRLTYETRCEQHYEIEQDGQSIGHVLAVIERAGIQWQVLTVLTLGAERWTRTDPANSRYDAKRARNRHIQAIETARIAGFFTPAAGTDKESTGA